MASRSSCESSKSAEGQGNGFISRELPVTKKMAWFWDSVCTIGWCSELPVSSAPTLYSQEYPCAYLPAYELDHRSVLLVWLS